ncbi:hypothetical protein EXN66_Car002028 [Channa argus]|uniref:Uncharacterized protein n=1 Tax=Channa argus TaxID=215402 RepID=A0A6G1P8I8_CHAAH|nr:hypothetical protein EXN66_Car002028 [Channa argus]
MQCTIEITFRNLEDTFIQSDLQVSSANYGFSVLPSCAETCSQKKPGVEILTLWFVDDCSTN